MSGSETWEGRPCRSYSEKSGQGQTLGLRFQPPRPAPPSR